MKRLSRKALALLLTLCLIAPASSAFAVEERDTVTFDGELYCGSESYLPFFYTVEDGAACITDCLPFVSGDAVIPREIDGYVVRSIGARAFEGCADLSSLTVPESISKIAEDAVSPALLLRGVKGCYTEEFARENGIAFSVVETTGDVNRDGTLNVNDLATLAQYIAGWNVSVSQIRADLDENRTLDVNDLADAAQRVAGWNTKTVYLLGDETAKAEGFDGYYPALGWGEALPNVLNGAEVQNLAFSGASAKNTRTHSEYLTLLNRVQAGDVVLLSFGIHDADSLAASYAPAAGEYTERGSFAYYLYEYYLLPLKARGATPVLLTPVVSRPADGITFTENTLRAGYPDALRVLAESTDTPLLDLCNESRALYESLGASQNAYLNAWENRDVSTLSADYLSVLGAEKIACLVAEELAHLFDSLSANETDDATVDNYLATFGATAKKTVFTYSDGTTSETNDTTISRESYSVPEGESLVSVQFAEGVRAIAPYAFALQYELENLGAVLPNSLVTISDGAFHSCHNLWLDLFPENLAEIGESAFYGCENLRVFDFAETITSIGAYAFYGCDSIEAVIFNASVDSVPEGAFGSCDSLSTVEFSAFVEEIGKNAFENCKSITELTLPAELSALGRRALKGTSLTTLSLPETLTSLGAEAFSGSAKLSSLNYPLLATDWVAVTKGDLWYKNTALSLVNCFDGEVTVEGMILVDYHAYYSDFETALSDANAYTTASADLTRHEKEQAVAAILLEEDGLTLKLLRGTNLFTLTSLSGEYTLDLQGNTIAFCTAGSHFELAQDAKITVRDSVGGGKVYKHIDSASAQYLYNLPNTGSVLTLEGGIHTCENNSGSSIAVRGMGKANSAFYMSGGSLSATTSSSSASANAKAVQAPEYTEISGGALVSKTVSGNSYTVSGIGTFVIRGGTFDSYTKYGNSMALFAGSGTSPTDVVIYDGTFTTHANGINGKHIAFSTATGASAVIYNGTFTVDSKKTGDAGACGIATAGPSLIIYDAFVQGNSAGLQALGVNTVIYGGTYIGADHGGAYFAHNGEIGTIAVLGGTFRFVQPEWQGSTSGTGSAYFTGGGKIYIDSATFEGRQVSISNLAGTSEETTVYVSRTTAPTWRVDSLHTVYFGKDMGGALISGNGTIDRTLYASTVFDEAFVNSVP